MEDKEVGYVKSAYKKRTKHIKNQKRKLSALLCDISNNENNVGTIIQNDTYILEGIIEKGLKSHADERYEEYKKELLERIEREKPAVIASILVDVMRTTDFQVLQDRILFTIKRN